MVTTISLVNNYGFNRLKPKYPENIQDLALTNYFHVTFAYALMTLLEKPPGLVKIIVGCTKCR